MSDFSQHCMDAADHLIERLDARDEQWVKQMTELRMSIDDAKARRLTVPHQTRRVDPGSLMSLRVRELSPEQRADEDATTLYETSGQKFAAQVASAAAGPFAGVRFSERRQVKSDWL